MVNKLEEEWKTSEMLEWYTERNWHRIYDLVCAELIIKKSDLGWWRRNYNTDKDLTWVQRRAETILNKEFDALRGNHDGA